MPKIRTIKDLLANSKRLHHGDAYETNGKVVTVGVHISIKDANTPELGDEHCFLIVCKDLDLI